jgi:hypothetical protein
MMRILNSAMVLALLCSSAAFAQDEQVSATSDTSSGGSRWSVLSGQTVGRGNKVLHGQLGWPGASGAFLYGVNDRFDVGARLSLNYGIEGYFAVMPGFKAQGVLRFNFVNNNQFNFGLSLEPGFYSHFSYYYSMFGIALPVGLNFGIRASSALMVNVGMDVPLSIAFFSYPTNYPGYGGYYYYSGSNAVLMLPILVGGGIEYAINQRVALTYNMRFGPVFSGYYGAPVAVTMYGLVGVAFRL